MFLVVNDQRINKYIEMLLFRNRWRRWRWLRRMGSCAKPTMKMFGEEDSTDENLRGWDWPANRKWRRKRNIKKEDGWANGRWEVEQFDYV